MGQAEICGSKRPQSIAVELLIIHLPTPPKRALPLCLPQIIIQSIRHSSFDDPPLPKSISGERQPLTSHEHVGPAECFVAPSTASLPHPDQLGTGRIRRQCQTLAGTHSILPRSLLCAPAGVSPIDLRAYRYPPSDLDPLQAPTQLKRKSSPAQPWTRSNLMTGCPPGSPPRTRTHVLVMRFLL